MNMLTGKELDEYNRRRDKIKKAMRDGQPTPLSCSCGGFLVITRNCEGFQETCFCRSCGLMYNLKIIATRLVAHHNYTVDFYGRLSSEPKEDS